jgi:hypothetical protein
LAGLGKRGTHAQTVARAVRAEAIDAISALALIAQQARRAVRLELPAALDLAECRAAIATHGVAVIARFDPLMEDAVATLCDDTRVRA